MNQGSAHYRRLTLRFALVLGAVIALNLAQPLGAYAQTKQYTVGFNIFNGSHPWAVECIKFVRWVAKSLNVKLVIAYDNVKLEDQVANVENFISSGVDGVLILPLFPTIAPRVAPILEKAKMPWGTYNATLPQEIMNGLYGYKYFIGYTGQPNSNATGADAANFLLQQGKRKSVVLSSQRGLVMHEERVTGFTKTFQEGGGKVLAVQWNNATAEDSTKAMESVLAAYPDVDSVYGTGDPYAIGAVEALRRHNLLDRVMVAGTDMSQEALELFNKGDLKYESGGQWAEAGFALMRLYNVMASKPVGTNKDMAAVNVLSLKTIEDSANYQKLIVDRPPYSEQEIRNLVKPFNSAFTLKMFQDAMARHSVQDTVARRAKDTKNNAPFPPLYTDITW